MLGTVPMDDRVQPADPDEWRAWLEENHDRGVGVWLVSWKAHTGRPTTSYEHAVEQALCFGWVDSTNRTLDADRTMMWFAPRRRRSGWARSNKQRVARLEAAELMTPPGRAVIDAAKADGSWSLLDEVEDLIVPPDLADAFDEHPGAREHWDAFTRSARRAMLAWIVQARKPETRARRIADTAEKAAVGERANEPRPRT